MSDKSKMAIAGVIAAIVVLGIFALISSAASILGMEIIY